ncbi:MAG: polyhydroxyalkanoate depolymerase [Burkholderiaceae bacterium]|nr:polyhydroxyalkanoate depolymerase [Burkholderiaceae bacterium]
MLYDIREAQRAFLNPLSNWADSMSQLYTNPYSPLSYVPFANRISAGLELVHRLGKEYEKPRFDIRCAQVAGREVPVAERVEVVRPFCRLLKFERLLPEALAHRRNDPAVLVFAPLSGHHATLLRDTVQSLLADHTVYITDWVDARMVPLREGNFQLDDYVGYAIEFIRRLGPDVHVMSVCQPTVPVLGAISLMASMGDAALPRSMTMMGGPIDARRSPTEVNNLARTRSFEWFERTVIYRVPAKYPGAGRRVYPGFLQHAGFVAMNPDRHVNSHWDFYLSLVKGDLEDAESHRRFYDEYNAVLDLPAEYYLDTIRTVFQDYALPLGRWRVWFEGEHRRVAPEDIRTVPLLTVEGELDDISGQGQTKAAHELCAGLPASMKKHITAAGAGHYGIFSGRRWREILYPEVRDFIAASRQRAKLRRVV